MEKRRACGAVHAFHRPKLFAVASQALAALPARACFPARVFLAGSDFSTRSAHPHAGSQGAPQIRGPVRGEHRRSLSQAARRSREGDRAAGQTTHGTTGRTSRTPSRPQARIARQTHRAHAGSTAMKHACLVLGVHAIYRGFGWILMEGPSKPIDWGVSEKKKDKNTQCLFAFERILSRYHPDILAIETFTAPSASRATRIRRLYRAMLSTVEKRGIKVRTYEIG